ncbi:MAG TPA: tRNA pseudouridine(13) synthase TruD [Humisphaera sp.]|jgi:tRNA pseudouridine13 synthase|nr:tRNA pseudouridine(13) synthase TruD [Humisphaera sp.]
MPLPYLTRDFPGIGGVIKQRPEDFFVQEMPLYEPSGEGEHVYCEIQKVGIPTFEAIDRLSKALHISGRDIGYAGLKDAQAVSRQIFSIQGTTPEAVMNLRVPGLTVQWAARHGNKLRLGHLSGNRFAIKIREVNPTDVVKIQPVLAEIERRGMPNYFGEQRFGRRGDNDMLGAAYVRGDDDAVLHLLLGNPISDVDDGQTHAARAAFDRNDRENAMKAWPRRCGMERRILARLIKTQRPGAAVRAVDEKLRRLWVSALQSRLFNQVVAQRIDSLDKLMDGDIAYKHVNGAPFHVESAAIEQPRADSFEISPSGPLIGFRVVLPTGKPLEMEQAVFAESGLAPADFKRTGQLRVKGTRRPLRVKPEDMQVAGGVDEHGAHVTVAFTLPAGSFATVLLRELMKAESLE